jgi:5-hydroxyisourate hydrolase
VSGITTHVLDTSLGRPARGVPVRLEARAGDSRWVTLGERATDDDGRVKDLHPAADPLEPGVYRLTFQVATYFGAHGMASFYPEVQVTFEVRDAAQHHHVPLLVSPFGYSTYRGS